MKYHRSQKDVLIGIAVGLIVNVLGMFLWWLIFSKSDLETTFVYAYEEDMLGAIIGLGAILNLLAFFGQTGKRSVDGSARTQTLS